MNFGTVCILDSLKSLNSSRGLEKLKCNECGTENIHLIDLHYLNPDDHYNVTAKSMLDPLSFSPTEKIGFRDHGAILSFKCMDGEHVTHLVFIEHKGEIFTKINSYEEQHLKLEGSR